MNYWYPSNYNPKENGLIGIPLQSYLFGHRIQASQTKNEYLIEFLQVAISEKTDGQARKYNGLFPVSSNRFDSMFTYKPKTGIALKRFVFLPKSKLAGKAAVDVEAYKECIALIAKKLSTGSEVKSKNAVLVLQNLLNGFSAVSQNRAWFDQNMLPICPEVILPEGMGVKSWRQGLEFKTEEPDVDGKFDFHRYTYMCRGGEVYYLHVLNALNDFPKYRNSIENGLNRMLNSFPQFSSLCNFILDEWDKYMNVPADEVKPVIKTIGAIPAVYSQRNEYLLIELKNFLNNKIHPFEKIEMYADGIILQILRVMYLCAKSEKTSVSWIIDVNCKDYPNPEMKKLAINSFKHNEETISSFLYKGLDIFKDELHQKDEQKIIRDAAEDSYKLFRKMGKSIGIIIPMKGPGMRFTLSEEIIKFLVLSILPPKGMVTLDEFIEQIYVHFGMIVAPDQYKTEVEAGLLYPLGDYACLEDNKKALSQKLKDCGFLRDLSDATAIVENPFESEEQIQYEEVN